MREIRITKRDGSTEAFSVAKLRVSLSRALHAAESDAKLAAPLAKAVAVHLEDWSEPLAPSTEYIFRCVRSVLRQTGLEDAATAYGRSRRLREDRRRRVRIVERAAPRGRFSPWRKSALVRTLTDEFGIGRPAARFLAGRTEEQVFALNYRLVSRALVAELMRNEMLAWGLTDETPDAPRDRRSPQGQPTPNDRD